MNADINAALNISRASVMVPLVGPETAATIGCSVKGYYKPASLQAVGS